MDRDCTTCIYYAWPDGKGPCRLCASPEYPYWQHNTARNMPQESQQQSATATQVGGTHYTDMAIQPAEYIHRNGIGFLDGAAIKYLSRWRKKGGKEDLRKAVHMIELLMEMEP